MAVKALAGWKRDDTQHGIVLTVQLAETARDFDRGQFEEVAIVLNRRQLRSLARDLTRAASARGMETFAARGPWWRFWRRR